MNKQNKCIIIATTPQTVTLTTFFFELAKQFKKRGYDVVMIFDKQKVRECNPEGIVFKSWPSYRPTKLKDFLFLKKIIKKYNPLYTISSFGAVNVSLIVSFFLNVPNRIAWNHTNSRQLKYDSKNKFRTWILKLRKSIILNLFASEVHTNSKDSKADTIVYLKFPKNKIKVINFLLKTYDFELNKKKKIISFIGRFSQSKGQIILLKAIPKVLKKFPNYKFYFVGSGELLNYLKKESLKIGIYQNCVFTGAINQREVYKILSESKLHISASEDEAFGLVNLEAISYETPILAHKVGGIPEILMNGVNGYFFKKNDIDDLAKIIINLLKDETLYKRLQKGCNKIYENKFKLNEVNLNKIVDLILIKT